MTTELRPCPFCGGEAEITKHFEADKWWRLSHRCKPPFIIHTDWICTRQILVDGWNGVHDREAAWKEESDRLLDQLRVENIHLRAELAAAHRLHNAMASLLNSPGLIVARS